MNAPAARQGSELAGAKINLALHVNERRADGYHAIETFVVFAECGDTVRLVARDAAVAPLTVDGPFAGALVATTTPADNLVKRAAVAMGAGALTMTLTKRLPIGAGLGGGSADAAAVLRLLQRRTPSADAADVAAVALGIGADVPMCLVQRPLIARGIGEQISTVASVPPLPMVLACPPVVVSTAAVFAALDGEGPRGPLPPLPQRFSSLAEVADWLRHTRNDLGPPAATVSPAAAEAERAVAAETGCLFARMTGSGPTAFGIFTDSASAERAAARLGAANPAWWVVATLTGGS